MFLADFCHSVSKKAGQPVTEGGPAKELAVGLEVAPFEKGFGCCAERGNETLESVVGDSGDVT
jgi:hypothetical protein